MASQAETRAVYGAGLVQGVALVAFPASSAILTSPQYYDLSSTAYGALFLPQAAAAILAALSGTAPDATDRDQAHLPGGTGRRPRRDVAARREPVLHRAGSDPVRDAAAGDDEPRRRLRPDGAGDQYLRSRVRAGRRGSCRAVPERPARPRHGARPGPRGGLRWDRLLVGPAAPRRAPDRGSHRVQPAAAAGSGRPVGTRATPGPACHRGSGSSPRSRCCTAWSRRRTATGQRCT